MYIIVKNQGLVYMKRTSYDYVVSLGEKCFVAQTLNALNIRKTSSPFDWVDCANENGGLSSRLDLIINNFFGFFDKEYLYPVFEENYRLFANKYTNLSFRHEFSQNDDFDTSYPNIKEKYDRRIQRFVDMLKSKKKILFVYSTSIYENININEVISKLQQISDKYNNRNIYLLVVNSDRSLKRKNNIKYTRITKHLTVVHGCDLYKAISDTQPKYHINVITKILKNIIAENKMSKQNIISLTSFPARINDVHRVIQSLLDQTVKPNKIVLYLSEAEFPDKMLPQNLLDLTKNNLFEIKFVSGALRSYNKLVWALQDFPYANIITVDDDVIYPKTLLKALLKRHNRYPNDIIAHRIRKINITNNKIQPYRTWRLSERRGLFNFYFKRGYNNLLCGIGGVLYPPKSLYKDVLLSEKFVSLCKHQDDVWFWAMAVQNNRKISLTSFGYDVRARTIEEVQSVGLWNSINSKQDSPNNVAINNVIKEYPALKKKLGLE